jgi:hypothetical protein
MAERASIFQTVQIGVQALAGVGVAADKKLQSLNIEPAINIETSKFRAMGNKFPALVIPQKEMVQAKLSGVQTYTELIYPLASVLSYAAPVQQGATVAYKWTFSPQTAVADTVKLFTVEQGSAERAHKFIDGLVTGLELSFSRDGCEISGGDMIGAALQDNIVMTAAPTAIALVPVIPTQIDVFLADTQAGLDAASALLRVISAAWKISGRFGPVFPLATAMGTGYAAIVETEPTLECTFKMEADAEGMGLLNTLRAGVSKFLRILGTGAEIEAPYNYELQIDTAVKVSEVSEFSDEDGLFAIEWTFTGVHDATWGKATQIDIINTIQAL